LRARELDPSVDVTVVVADAFPNFSICGLPYYLSGDVGDWRDLAHRTTADLEQAGIGLLPDHTAQAIDPAAKQVTVTSQHGERQLGYDRLVIGTGAVPVRPPIDGLDLPGVQVLHTMADTFALHHALAAGAQSAVIVGGGYIGLEMAEAFTARGLDVTVVEQAPAVMPSVDLELGRLLGEELRRHGVRVVNDVTVKAIHHDAGGLTVAGEPDFTATADLVLVVVGVRPDTQLAVAVGVQTGVRGALRVDRRMRTNLPDVLAAGDCVETWHRLLKRPAYLPLGTTAHKQGRVAGETAVGGDREFAGSLGTQVVKVFELAVARTGLRDQEAAAAGLDPLTVASTQFDHKAYYPGARQLYIRITGDRTSGRLLGAQLVGDHRAEVAKRIDIPANALHPARRPSLDHPGRPIPSGCGDAPGGRAPPRLPQGRVRATRRLRAGAGGHPATYPSIGSVSSGPDWTTSTSVAPTAASSKGGSTVWTSTAASTRTPSATRWPSATAHPG
ncbi:MAG TPA: FAD-dependent oxidoreductase, partial [Actinomycetes bacterium]|nr:FAD-dependent oxidoreductase [Actinomycetes bacterium]